jgi:hypothetical protein
MDDLPEELVEHILQYVKDLLSPTTFWDCLRTCRQWHRIGLGLYKGLGFAVIAILESESRRYQVQEESVDGQFSSALEVQFQTPSTIYMALLKSMTVHVRHQRIATPFTPSTNNDLGQSLTGLFKLTKRLTTFSLKVTDGWDCRGLDVPAVPGSLLARIVQILPETVANLELDTSSIDLPPCGQFTAKQREHHLCYQISRILRRLRHLRLRVGHVCDVLLALEPDADDCGDIRGCDYCATNEQATCSLVRNWRMRTMIVWLPWGQDTANNALAKASKALLDASLRNATVILLISQTDEEVSRISISDPSFDPFQRFSWSVKSNVSATLQEKLDYFRFKSISGTTVYRNDTRYSQGHHNDCLECESLHRVEIRQYILSGLPIEVGAMTAYPYVAEQTVEHMISWTQSSATGYRFPMPEADDPSKPFFQTADLWPCLFPGCHVRSKTLVHLRGHHIYAHPKYPTWKRWGGYQPCPRSGCDRVGENGFKDREELERHLRGHHLRPCTMTKIYR